MRFSAPEPSGAPPSYFRFPVIVDFGAGMTRPVAWCQNPQWAARIAQALNDRETISADADRRPRPEVMGGEEPG